MMLVISDDDCSDGDNDNEERDHGVDDVVPLLIMRMVIVWWCHNHSVLRTAAGNQM